MKENYKVLVGYVSESSDLICSIRSSFLVEEITKLRYEELGGVKREGESVPCQRNSLSKGPEVGLSFVS